MTSTETPTRRISCRYLRRNDRQCTAEAADPNADVLLCARHLARVIEHARATYERYRREAGR